MTFTRPKLMGILNVTPDSFSDGGRFYNLEAAVEHALNLIDAGADIIDIGGESTRPGAEEVSIEEEIHRTIPVIAALREATDDYDVPPVISIDTRKPQVAEAAVHMGADIWNDVTALTFDPYSEKIAAELACPLILMHIQGSPETMQNDPRYGDPVIDIKEWLEKRIEAAEFAGVERKNITLDPGIGFGKRLSDNLAILKNLTVFKSLGFPILMGTSRKSFMGKIDGSAADDRLGGSIASALWCAANGADILRVHDMAQTRQALLIWESITHADL